MGIQLKTIFILVTLFFGILKTDFAQRTKEDSLINILNATSEDSIKVKFLLQLARSFDFYEREKSIEYYKKALKFEQDKRRTAEILDTIGFFNWQLGNLEESIEFYSQSELLFTELNDSLWLGRIYNTLGVCYWGLGKGNEALKFYQKAAKIRKGIGDNTGTARVLNNISIIYRSWGLYEDAIKFNKEALTYAFVEKNNYVVAFTYSNIGNYYENVKDYSAALTNYNIGFQYLLKEEEINNSNSYFSEFFGNVYFKTGKLDSALYYYNKSLDYANRINNQNRISIAEYNLGKTYFQLNQIEPAKKHILYSFSKSLEKNYKNLQKDNMIMLAKISEKEGNISNAFNYLKRASELKDSLFNTEKIANFNELQKKYITEQHEQENVLLRKDIEIQQLRIQKQKNIGYIYIISIIFFVIILYFILKNRAALQKLNIKLKESEKELIIANANKDKFFTIIAHDLKSPFNGLLGITDLLNTNFDDLSTEKIKKMIHLLNESSSKVYALLEGLLQWAQIQTGKMEYQFENIDLLNSCGKAIGLLSTNAFSKQIVLDNKIKENTMVYADQKATETIFRNLISNAIKFTNSGGQVTIESENHENEISVSISDTGTGMQEELKNNLFKIEVHNTSVGTNDETGTGLGLILCKELIEKNGGKIRVESKPGVESKFTFTLPRSKNL